MSWPEELSLHPEAGTPLAYILSQLKSSGSSCLRAAMCMSEQNSSTPDLMSVLFISDILLKQ